MKKILGLDLGTNSIGWALVENDFESKRGNILGTGSRIIPMSQDVLDNFGKGQSHSQTAERTHYRSVRRLHERQKLRRERLHRVLNILGFLPSHYATAIDFIKHPGQCIDNGENHTEIKINYRINDEGSSEFLFQESYQEMVADFSNSGWQMNLPYDWTIYYLRKKALNNKITKEELSWLILNFNQKRGYYQLRDEDDQIDSTKREEYCTLEVLNVEPTEDKNDKGTWYHVHLENGLVYKRQSKESLESWVGTLKEFIITTQLEKDGSTKLDNEGIPKKSFRSVDSEKDWIAIKSKTEKSIEDSNKTVGEFIYDTLLETPDQKIRGKLVRTIERKYYRNELEEIIKKQMNFHGELKDAALLEACVRELYPHNEAHRNKLLNQDFLYLFVDDIIFYQRPLKSKKSSISVCSYETRTYLCKVNELNSSGELEEKTILKTEGIKGIPKSHPLYQEFRLWQFLSNLRILRKDPDGDKEVTGELLLEEKDRVDLFDFLNHKKELEQKQVIEYFVKKSLIAKSEKEYYRWNYVETKQYPGNETRAMLLSRLSKVKDINLPDFLTPEIEKHLWHIIYSIKDKVEYEKALHTFASKYEIDIDSFLENFRRISTFDNDYGSFSYKAIRKLLPLMRMGKYWNEDEIDPNTKLRIAKLIDSEFDEHIRFRIRELAISLKTIDDYKGLPVWLACYIVYDRHSESIETGKWNSVEDIDAFLKEFKQHSLRNPIVEQVVTESLRVVRDVWKYYGNGDVNFFDEIHLELGRDMKNPADKRRKISEQNLDYENTNHRIRELLTELMADPGIKGEIRPFSPSHQEILKLYEEGIYQNSTSDYNLVSSDEIEKIRKSSTPTKTQINRYKLWLEQGYRSPYTGEMIPLSKLFTPAYQIEHIIPQSRYFDDSLTNKVISESVVNANPYKDNQTGYEFIKNNESRVVSELSSNGKTVKIFTLQQYEEHCSKYFGKNRQKLKKLLTEDIPEGFIERQMNDSRYISKYIKALLNNIVKDEREKEFMSSRILPVPGSITSKLRQDWGLNDKWNEIVSYRFKRLNHLSDSSEFGFWDEKINAFRCEVPTELKKGFSKKRIDHRHHALDAIVIACTNRKHIQYLNALNAQHENYSLRKSLLVVNKNGDITRTMELPWDSFPVDVLNSLAISIVSFKQNNRVINKTRNKTLKWINSDGHMKKAFITQQKGENWAIRKPMHKETVFGSVKVRKAKVVAFDTGINNWSDLVDKKLKQVVKNLIREGQDLKSIKKHFKSKPYMEDGILVKNVEIYTYTTNATATRVTLTEKFTRKQLNNITDTGIRKILEQHLKKYTNGENKENFDLAFSSEGLEALNKNIVDLNGGKSHKPIRKVRIFEEGNKYSIGYIGNKGSKFVEAAKGTNLFFSIYKDESGNRNYTTVPLNEVIEHQIQVAGLPASERTPVPLIPEMGTYLFTLSPNDLVYVPNEDDIENPHTVDFEKLSHEQVMRIYKMVSSSKKQCHFIPHSAALPIKIYDNISKLGEFESLNKMEKSLDGSLIKEICWKLQVDRLGRITKIYR